MKQKFFKSELLADMRVLVKRSAQIYGEKIAFQELGTDREIQQYSFSRLEKDVDALGTKLVEMGLHGAHIAVLGESSYAWVMSYLAIVNGVGIVVPMDKELTDEEIAALLNKSDTEAIICSQTFTPIIQKILPTCPKLKTCITMHDNADSPDFFALSHLINEGQKLLEEGNHSYLEMPIDREAMCEIVFTSGTTGANKGVMLSHKNIMAVVYGALSLIEARGVSFSVLPINHTYECSCHILGGIYSGLTICFNDSLKRVIDNINLFKPTMSLMVPLFLESIYKNIWRQAKKNGLDNHLRYGLKVSNLLRKVRIDQRRKYFKPVLGGLGGNLQQVICGGAPLRTEIIKGLTDLGIEILNGYGITECAPLVSTNSVLCKKSGSVGRVIPGCQVRIADPDENGNGEVQIKGDNVMLGYYKDEESTRASFTDDGWYKTGDLGYLDRDSFLYLRGRKKNLIILANGKNVHPEEIEDIIIAKLPYVKEVVVFAPDTAGGEEGCITACVYLDEEYANTNGLTNIREKVDQDVRIMNRRLPVYKRINKVIIREVEFEKTTTKKIKRRLIVS